MLKKEYEFEILDENFKDELHNFFKQLEEELQKPNLGDLVFQIVYELINNAIKSNLKRIFFIKNNYSLENTEEYTKGLEEFKKYYQLLFKNQNLHNHKDLTKKEEWIEALKDLGLKVHLTIDIDTKRILIYVINNTRILPEEEKRLRKSLSIAMHSKDLIDFMIHYGPISEEGEGLGLPLVVFLIKEAGFKPEYFRVFKDDQNTIARIEFPLSSDYVAIRDRKNLI